MFRLLICYVVLVGFNLPSATAQNPVPQPDKVRLQLKWRHQFQFAGYYAAQEKGYYREAGLEVELIEARPGLDPMMAVVEGHAEFGVSTAELLLLRAEGYPVVALATIFQHSPLVLLARREAGIDHLHDLTGKRVMIEPHSAELYAYLRNESIPIEDLQILEHSFEIKDLIEGRTDAFSAYVSDEFFDLRNAGIPYVQFVPRTGGIDFYGDGLFTTQDYIDQNPQQVLAFRAASLRGWQYALDHPEEMVDLIIRRYGHRKSREHLLFEAKEMIRLIQPELIGIGYMNPGRWRHMADTFAELGMMPHDFSLDGFLYPESLDPDLTFFYLLAFSALGVACIAGLVAWRFHVLNRRIRHNEQRYRNIYESAPLAFVLWDTSHRIRMWNRQAEAMFGWSQDEARDKNLFELIIPQDQHDHVRKVIDTLHEKKLPVISTNRNVTRDGKTLWCTWSNVEETDDRGNVAGILSIALDITDRRKAEETLRQAHEAKSDFLAMMSHEIRTPMNAIIGYASLLRSSDLNTEQTDMAAIIQYSSENLLNILNDVLNFSKMEAGKLEILNSSVNVKDLTGSVYNLLSPLARIKDLEFTWEIEDSLPQYLTLDPTRLRQILINLAGNAIKYTESGFIRIRVYGQFPAEDSPNGLLTFELTDSGVGISEEDQKKLFQPFQRLGQQPANSSEGTGLGLMISHRLAELMNGSITVQSEPGKGSVFKLQIQTTRIT